MPERWRRRCSIYSKRLGRWLFCLPVIWAWLGILPGNVGFGATEVKRFDTEGAQERRRKIGERQRLLPQRRRGRRERQPQVSEAADIVASWGAASSAPTKKNQNRARHAAPLRALILGLLIDRGT